MCFLSLLSQSSFFSLSLPLSLPPLCLVVQATDSVSVSSFTSQAAPFSHGFVQPPLLTGSLQGRARGGQHSPRVTKTTDRAERCLALLHSGARENAG